MSNDPMAQMRSVRFLLWVLILLLLFYLLPQIQLLWINFTAEPRSITARGELAPAETNNIQIFRQASPSVLFITTLSDHVDLWTRNITRIPRGTGSGFVWDKHGHIVTNYHVVAGADAVYVRLDDQRSFKAVLVGTSPQHDLAVLRMSMPLNPPPALPIGTSHDLQVGQMTYAIGNPFGLDHSLTTGVISALNRSIDTPTGIIKELIQTDAAINPGNSGGPLLDSAGRLIGVNTAIFSPSGAYAGIGFAVPVDTVNRVVPQLIAHGRYQRPQLGIGIDESLNKLISKRLGIKGVVVLSVEKSSAAFEAGLRGTRIVGDGGLIPGDVILKLGEYDIEDSDSLLDALENYVIGDEVSLRYWRDGEQQETRVVLQ
ncbi:S1C family serine protease [Thiolapillus sp.]